MAKRQWRNDMPQQQRDKIAQAHTGRKHTEQSKRKIADSLRKYWDGLAYKPVTSTGNTTGTTTGGTV
jgi:hypothetical protein